MTNCSDVSVCSILKKQTRCFALFARQPVPRWSRLGAKLLKPCRFFFAGSRLLKQRRTGRVALSETPRANGSKHLPWNKRSFLSAATLERKAQCKLVYRFGLMYFIHTLPKDVIYIFYFLFFRQTFKRIWFALKLETSIE